MSQVVKTIEEALLDADQNIEKDLVALVKYLDQNENKAVHLGCAIRACKALVAGLAELKVTEEAFRKQHNLEKK